MQITVDREVPDSALESLDEWKQVTRKEAEFIEEALISALPQGVYDALLVRMLDRKRSLFVVAADKTTITYERI